MAKVTFLQGKARGKVGGIVYRTEAGIGTIASEYNPSPRNPRTIAQVQQRSKMNLAGQLSKITPYIAIAGLDANRRKARSKFVSNVLKSITNDNNYSSVLPEEIVLSEGLVVAAAVTVTPSVENKTITVAGTVGGGDITVLGCVVVAYAQGGLNASNYPPECQAVLLDGGNINTTINLSTVASTSDILCYSVFLVPILDTGEGARAAYGDLSFYRDEQNGVFQTSYIRSLVSAGAYGHSLLVANGHTE